MIRLAALLVLLASACAPKPAEIACTMEARQCPDGSWVGRDPEKDCEFRRCP